MSIKGIIKNSELVKKITLLKRYKKDERFRQWINDYDGCHSIPKFVELGDKNRDKNIYIMKFDNAALGFFAYWRFAIGGLAFCERYGFWPVIDWTSNSPYYEERGINGIKNAFEYYYLQPSKVDLEDAYQSANVCFYSSNAIGIPYTKYNEAIDMDLWAKLTKKYLVLRPEIQEKLLKDIQAIFNNKKILGVQVRGVEWGKIAGHPVPVLLEEYEKKVREALEKNNYDKIFLATDSEDTIQFMKDAFQDKICFFEDVARAAKGSKTLAIFDNSIKRENNKFLLGYEVLRDMTALSLCDGLIATYSNISLAAEINKISREEKYEYKYIFNPEVNKSGLSPNKAVEKMKQGKF